MEVKEVEFVYEPRPGCQIRHRHVRYKRSITAFTVQLEVWHQGQWEAVVRYDTAHGFAHRDMIRADGRVEKTPLPLTDYNEALTFAEADLRVNSSVYAERFRKEAGAHD